MKTLMMIAALATTMLFATESNAQHVYRQGQHNQQAQKARIKQGVRSGSLTKYEARHLRLQQAKLRNMKQMAMRDGVVTRQERHNIRMAEARNSHHIYMQKNDRQYRRY